MRILLVVPRYNLEDKKNFSYVFPVGLGYISSAMKRAGYEVDCLNLNSHDGTIKEILTKRLNKKNYSVVCTGHLGVGYLVIEKILNAVREHPSKPTTILGGGLITSEPELMLKSLKPDFEVLGEGEVTIVELLKCIEKKSDPNKVKGIGFINSDGKHIFTKTREPIKDLDSLPMPDYAGLGFLEYLNGNPPDALCYILDNPRTYPILGSRGCPFQCTFCYHCLGPGYRYRSVNDMMEEIEYAIEHYKINSVFIYDDLFASNKERLYDFCKRMRKILKKIPDFKWCCSLWVSTVDKEILQTLKDSGCFFVAFGFESYSPIVLKSMKKYITPEQIDRAINLSKEVGIAINGNFIFGDTAETKETAKETLNYWKGKGRGQFLIGFIQPYPGSEIYKRCVEKKVIKDKLDYIKNHISYHNWFNMTDSMTDKEILWLKKEILKAKAKYCPYIVPSKLESLGKINGFKKYNLHLKCPFCKKKVIYRNRAIENKSKFFLWIACKNCGMKFFVCNFLYRIALLNYYRLDFFLKNYLRISNAILKKKI